MFIHVLAPASLHPQGALARPSPPHGHERRGRGDLPTRTQGSRLSHL